MEKFRPSLSEQQVETILLLCKSQTVLTDEIISVLKVFSIYEFKIKNSLISPQYKTKDEKQSTMQSLGFESIKPVSGKKDFAAIRKAAYEKWLETPGDCSIKELEDSMEHRIAFCLLSEEEKQKQAEEYMKEFNSKLDGLGESNENK